MRGTANDVLPTGALAGGVWLSTPVSQPVSGADIPILFEDEGQEDMGDSDIHTRTTGTGASDFPYLAAHRSPIGPVPPGADTGPASNARRRPMAKASLRRVSHMDAGRLASP